MIVTQSGQLLVILNHKYGIFVSLRSISLDQNERLCPAEFCHLQSIKGSKEEYVTVFNIVIWIKALFLLSLLYDA